jgi:L-amino acid N-acyltransferase YncA
MSERAAPTHRGGSEAAHASFTLVPMGEAHRRAVVDIFNYYVVNGFAAYPGTPLGDDLFDRFVEMTKDFPAVVVRMADGTVVGFGFIRPYHFADSFRRTAEVSYFIRPEHTRKGLGTAMLAHLFAEVRKKGVDTVLASLSSLNEESLAFHAKHGFVECGRFRDVGSKHGRSFDVVWMQRRL